MKKLFLLILIFSSKSTFCNLTEIENDPVIETIKNFDIIKLDYELSKIVVTAELKEHYAKFAKQSLEHTALAYRTNDIDFKTYIKTLVLGLSAAASILGGSAACLHTLFKGPGKINTSLSFLAIANAFILFQNQENIFGKAKAKLYSNYKIAKRITKIIEAL